MSQNRKLKRGLTTAKARQAEIRQGKQIMARLYFGWKHECLVKQYDQTQLRESMMELIIQVHQHIPWPVVQLPYVRGLEIMLNRIGGPLQSADGLYDAAVKKEEGENGPSDESIQQAMRELGMTMPAAVNPGAVGGPGGAADEAASRPPRYHRSFPDKGPLPPGSEGPAAA